MIKSVDLPYAPYLWKTIRRSAVTWLVIRSAYVVVLMIGVVFFSLLPFPEGVDSALHPPRPTRVLLVALTTFLVWWDRKRFNELIFSANLGTHPAWFWAASFVTASVLDLVVQALVQAF